MKTMKWKRKRKMKSASNEMLQPPLLPQHTRRVLRSLLRPSEQKKRYPDDKVPGPQLEAKQLPGERPRESAKTRHTNPQSSRHVRRKGAAPLSGAEEQTARAFRAYALCTCLLSLQMGSIN